MDTQIKKRILRFKNGLPDSFKKEFSALNGERCFKTLEEAKIEGAKDMRKYIESLGRGETTGDEVAVFETLDGEYLVVREKLWGEAEETCECILNSNMLMRLADGENVEDY